MNGNTAVYNGLKINLHIFGSVRFQVFPKNFQVVNETMPEHLLAPGYVDRRVIQVGNVIYIQTHGEGTGPFGELNADAADTLWHAVDAQIINSLPIYPPSRIKP